VEVWFMSSIAVVFEHIVYNIVLILGLINQVNLSISRLKRRGLEKIERKGRVI
jgi:hypothetical protein